MTLDLYTKLIFLVGISFCGFGVLAYTRDRTKLSNKLFGFLSISFAVWSFSWFFMLVYAEDDELAVFWARSLNLGAIWIPILYSHWVFSLLGFQKTERRFLQIGYALAAIFSGLSFTSYFIKGVHPLFFFPAWPDPGPLYFWFILLGYVGLVSFALFRVYQKFPHLTTSERYQILYVLIGSVLGFGGGATNFLGMYSIFWIHPIILFIGALGVMASPYFFAYSAVRYDLMNIRIVLSEAFGALLILILLIEVLTSKSTAELITNSIILAVITWVTYLLVKSAIREVLQREKIEILARELGTANEELKKLDAAKSEFISIASHQLRAPLTVIRGYVSMFLEGALGPIGAESKSVMKKVAISADQLVKLIADLLDLSRIDAGRWKYEMKNIFLDEIAEEVVKQFEINAKEKGLTFVFENRNEKKHAVNADADKMREVVINLIDNAIKYTASGRVSAELYPERRDGKQYVTFKVTDSGIGVSPNDIRRLFTKFTRTEEARRIRADGMGLGLYLVKKVAEDHGGLARVESPGLGKGSSFFVSLPAANT